MRAELDEMSATHNRMESIVFNLVDDMRDLKGTSRLQYKQFQTVSAELNHKTDKIRHENKKVLDRIRACQVSIGLGHVSYMCRREIRESFCKPPLPHFRNRIRTNRTRLPKAM